MAVTISNQNTANLATTKKS